jgi:small ligand-binding sensory domain FIST
MGYVSCVQWASTIANAAHLEDALEEALENVQTALGGASPHLLVAFAHPEYTDHLSRLVRSVHSRHPDAVLIGCSADGVIGGGLEVEDQPALSLTAAVLPGVEFQPFHLDGTPETWRERIALAGERAPAFLLLADPFSCPVDDTVRWLDTVYPGCPKIGGLASGGTQPGSTSLFIGPSLVRTGAVGVAMHGNIEVDTIVAQGCRPIGTPMFVTRAEDDVILELDGKPALQAVEQTYAQLALADQQLFRNALFLGLLADPSRQSYARGDFLVRNILGIDPELGALAVAAEVEENQVVQFHLRDAETSAADLIEMLERYVGPAPSGALLFSCLGRGLGLYGHADHDSDAFRRRFGDVALGGFFGHGEIGPVGGRTYVHGYTSAFALFRPRRPT